MPIIVIFDFIFIWIGAGGSKKFSIRYKVLLSKIGLQKIVTIQSIVNLMFYIFQLMCISRAKVQTSEIFSENKDFHIFTLVHPVRQKISIKWKKCIPLDFLWIWCFSFLHELHSILNVYKKEIAPYLNTSSKWVYEELQLHNLLRKCFSFCNWGVVLMGWKK